MWSFKTLLEAMGLTALLASAYIVIEIIGISL